ncbi:dermonecrotic toxin domain-containing protein [Pseudomonas sp. nanlin1]|uniref:dermonecrotic toxin domain-containing protein n=1 Tax=Pseudomonas sp. nanlin1 TaxID=3040605 RepID=UPI00388DCA35
MTTDGAITADDNNLETEVSRLRQAYWEAKVEQLYEQYPDLNRLAEEAAANLLLRLTGAQIDPHRVYWHHFSHTMSSPLTYTGWMHYGVPVHSLTLVELVLRRFDLQEQVDSDLLMQMGGFYTADANATIFDEHNEVRLDPRQVMDEFWRLDFAGLYSTRLKAFWINQRATYCLTAKISLLACATHQCLAGKMRAQDYTVVYHAVVNDPSTPFRPFKLQGPVVGTSSTVVRTFDIAGFTSDTVLRFCTPAGRQILYRPLQRPAFVAFDSDEQLYAWVQKQVNTPQGLADFMPQFVRREHDQQERWDNLKVHLQSIAETPWSPRHPRFNNVSVTVDAHAFTYLCDTLQRNMEQDLKYLLVSNSTLTKGLWINYLTTFTRLYGGFSLLSAPIAAATVAAGLVDVGLNIDKAVEGVNARERREGARDALLSSLNVVLTLPLLNEVSVIGDMGEAPIELAPPNAESNAIEGDSLTSHGLSPMRNADDPQAMVELEPYRPAVMLTGEDPMSVAGPLAGIYLCNGDETYAVIDGSPFRVRYVSTLKSWGVVDPANPNGFEFFVPIRRNESGQWQVGARLRLAGGGGGETQASAFLPLSAPTEAIVTQPLEADVTVELPLDGVERILNRYMIRVQRRGPVVAAYDADLGAWRARDRILQDVLWRTPEGRWQQGDEAQWRLAAAQAPAPVRLKSVLLPPLPKPLLNARPIPKTLHYIWVGHELPSDDLLRNIVDNSAKMKGYQSIVHSDMSTPELSGQLVEKLYEHGFSGTTLVLRNEPFFKQLELTDSGALYQRCRHGVARNLSAASDVLRYPLLDAYGGIYTDVDNAFTSVYDNVELPAGVHDVLLDDAVELDTLNFKGYNSHILGSHANNPVLRRITEAMREQFQANRAFYDQARPVLTSAAEPAQKAAFWAYMRKMFEMTGPTLLNRQLLACRPDYYELALRQELSVGWGVTSQVYEQRLNGLIDHYFPFIKKVEVEVGNCHSWLSTR